MNQEGGSGRFSGLPTSIFQNRKLGPAEIKDLVMLWPKGGGKPPTGCSGPRCTVLSTLRKPRFSHTTCLWQCWNRASGETQEQVYTFCTVHRPLVKEQVRTKIQPVLSEPSGVLWCGTSTHPEGVPSSHRAAATQRGYLLTDTKMPYRRAAALSLRLLTIVLLLNWKDKLPLEYGKRKTKDAMWLPISMALLYTQNKAM